MARTGISRDSPATPSPMGASQTLYEWGFLVALSEFCRIAPGDRHIRCAARKGFSMIGAGKAVIQHRFSLEAETQFEDFLSVENPVHRLARASRWRSANPENGGQRIGHARRNGRINVGLRLRVL